MKLALVQPKRGKVAVAQFLLKVIYFCKLADLMMKVSSFNDLNKTCILIKPTMNIPQLFNQIQESVRPECSGIQCIL